MVGRLSIMSSSFSNSRDALDIAITRNTILPSELSGSPLTSKDRIWGKAQAGRVVVKRTGALAIWVEPSLLIKPTACPKVGYWRITAFRYFRSYLQCHIPRKEMMHQNSVFEKPRRCCRIGAEEIEQQRGDFLPPKR